MSDRTKTPQIGQSGANNGQSGAIDTPNNNINDAIFLNLPDDDKAHLLAQIATRRGDNGQSGDDAQSGGNPWLDQVRTLKDAYSPRPPVTYLVGGVLPEGSLGMFFGVPGGFKSMAMADMAICVASGTPWLSLPDGRGGRATTAVPVLWIDCDNGKRRTDMRFDAMGTAYGLAATTPLYYLSMPHPGLNLADATSAMMLHDTVKAFRAGLVVIDNLGLIAGDVDENNSKMSTVMGELRKLAEDTNAAVVVLHHQRKTADKDQQMNVIRGHSSIAASLDLAIHISRDTAEKSTAVLLPVKARDNDIPMMAAQFSYRHVDGTNGELAEARFFGHALIDTNSKHAVQRAVMTALYGGVRLNQKDLVAAVQGEGITAGQNNIRNIITEMAARGEITEGSGANGAKLYHLS